MDEKPKLSLSPLAIDCLEHFYIRESSVHDAVEKPDAVELVTMHNLLAGRICVRMTPDGRFAIVVTVLNDAYVAFAAFKVPSSLWDGERPKPVELLRLLAERYGRLMQINGSGFAKFHEYVEVPGNALQFDYAKTENDRLVMTGYTQDRVQNRQQFTDCVFFLCVDVDAYRRENG